MSAAAIVFCIVGALVAGKCDKAGKHRLKVYSAGAALALFGVILALLCE